MKYKHLFLLVAITFGFVTKNFSQHKTYAITNGIGVFGGITKFNITTDNFITEQGDGFLGGLSATVDIPHKWYNISYGMQMSESNIGISARPSAASSLMESIEYKMFAAQVALMMHLKLVENNFTIDVGPMIQYNGKLELKDESKEGYIINDYVNLKATDITNISQFNLNGAVGASLGLRFIKLKAQYVYGFTNILKKLENQNLDTSGGDERFKGNMTMLTFGAMISF